MWHYSLNGSAAGPIKASELTAMIESGVITGDTLVWCNGMAEWLPLHQTELAGLLAHMNDADDANPYQTPQAALHDPISDSEPATPLTWTQVFWSFQGRIPRKTYWLASLVWICVFVITWLLILALGESSNNPDIALILMLIVFIPYLWSSIAIQAKRWHDRDKSAIMVLINLIPYIGGFWVLIECGCLRGTVGPNKYGNDPI